jgi:hypothetical protein
MANAIKVELAKVLALANELGMNVNLRASDAKVYKEGTAGSSPCIQLLFGGKARQVSGMDVVNCLVSSAVPHRNVEKPTWYGTVQQQINWASEQEALLRFRDACLDIKEGKSKGLTKGGKGQGAPDHKRDPMTGEVVVAQAPVEQPAEEPVEQEQLAQAANQ